MLEEKGFNFRDEKPGQGNNGKIDIWKDVDKDIFWSLEGSNHYEPLYMNWYEIVTPH